MQNVPAQGYLADFEASHLLTQAIPGALVLHLRRELEAETRAGRPPKRMFIELSMGEAVQHWQHLGELIRKAGAMEQRASYAGGALNL